MQFQSTVRRTLFLYFPILLLLLLPLLPPPPFTFFFVLNLLLRLFANLCEVDWIVVEAIMVVAEVVVVPARWLRMFL